MLNKLYYKIAGAVGAGVAVMAGMYQTAGAQFSVSTSTLNTLNGSFLTTVYDYVSSTLSTGGLFLFGVVITILTIVIWLAWNKLRHIFG